MTVALERPAAATTTPAATQTGTAPAGSTASASARATANQAAAAPVADPRIKQKGEAKTARIPIKIIPIKDMLRKPEWIRKQAPKLGSRYYEMKEILRDHKLHTVCEEASCPNIGECFGKGTASFMIMGDKCTRRCPFCDVGHGRPDPLDQEEPHNLAQSVKALRLKYVVITSVDATTCATVAPATTPTASAKSAASRRSPRSRFWCPTSAAVWTRHWTFWTPCRPT